MYIWCYKMKINRRLRKKLGFEKPFDLFYNFINQNVAFASWIYPLQYSNEMDNMQKLSIIITDMQGRIIRQMEFDNNADILVDTKDIQSGVYIVALYTDKLLLDKKTLTIVK